MSLKEYVKKRKLNISKEPSGIKNNLKINLHNKLNKKEVIFVVQRHNARNLHYDFRIELDGVLKSWAIPKEPPKTTGIKRLAINVEDHPLGYEKFHGVIPEGNYGAGTVKIWDKGKYELKNRDSKKIEVILHGKKLKGNYVLVKTNFGSKPEKSWLLMKV